MIELDKIYNEDCLEGMKRIPDGMVDAIITDLPYGTTACAWDAVIPFEPMWNAFKRIVKPKGNIVLFASGRFMFELYASQPNLYRYDLIWQKSRCGSPLTAPYMPLKMHEHILIFGRSGAVYNPQMTTGGTPYKKDYDHAYGIKNNHKYGIKGVHTDNHGERQPISVIKFDQKWRRQDQVHPTQKPVDLLRYLVLTYSNEGGGDSGRYNGQRHDRHRLHQGASALHRLRAEQGVFRQGSEAHQAGTGATDVILI